MKKGVFLFVSYLLLISALNAQPSRVKNDFNSYFKEQIGDDYLVIHTAAYKDVQRENIRVYLPEGEYFILPAPNLSFGKDIEIEISDDLYDVQMTSNGFYSIKASETKEYNFKAKAELNLQPNDLLFILYKKYDPYKKKRIKTLGYVDVHGKRFSFDSSSKKYSVIYFSSSLSPWSYKFAAKLNSLSQDFDQVAFLRLSSDSTTKLKEFELESNLKNWILIPNIRVNDDIQFNDLLSFPTFCITDNTTMEIVYHHVADYVNIEQLIRKNLNNFLRK
jgi:hypothetical protein